jgi:hypothetical protein
MHEQKNKDIKNVNKKNLEGINKLFTSGQADKNMSYILDSLTQFLDNNQNSTFESNSEHYFVDEATLGSALRKVKPETLDKEHLKQIATKINIDSKGNSGEIYYQL